MPILHSTVVAVADDGTSPVGTDEWNAAHVEAYAPGSFSLATGQYTIMSRHLILTTTQRVTLAGNSTLRIT